MLFVVSIKLSVVMTLAFGISASFGTEVGVRRRRETFRQILSSKVTYVELVGRRSRDLSGYDHFGFVVTTSSGKLWLIHKDVVTRIRYMSQYWVIVLGRSSNGSTVRTFRLRSPSFAKINNPKIAIAKMLEIKGIVNEYGEWIERRTGSLISFSFKQNHFKTWNSCTLHNLNRQQYFATTYIKRKRIQKLFISLSYAVRRCTVVQRSCNGQFDIFLMTTESTDVAHTDPYFNHTHETVKRLGSLRPEEVEIEYKNYTKSFEILTDKAQAFAVGFIDRGLCAKIYSIKLSYLVCPRKELNYAVYKEVTAPSNGSSYYQGYCVGNATKKSNGSLKWECKASGIGVYAEGCVCQGGFVERQGECHILEDFSTYSEDGGSPPASLSNGDKDRRSLILVIVLPVIGFVVLALLISFFLWKRRLHQQRMKGMRFPVTADMDDDTITYIAPDCKVADVVGWKLAQDDDRVSLFSEHTYIDPNYFEKDRYPVYQNIDHFEFPTEKLKILGTLGEGYFGSVCLAEAIDISGWKGTAYVAVKSLKESAKEEYGEAFLHELELLRNLQPHHYVVRLLGCCTVNGPSRIILEYMEKGDLRKVLRNSVRLGDDGQKRSSLPLRELLNFANMVAKGLEHLGKNKIVHRDIASRNVLVDHNLVCKISDLGLARYVDDDEIYRKGPEQAKLPVEWLAPESLFNGIFSFKSDVWSFGILLWEMFSYGETPYPGYKLHAVLDCLRQGYRMKAPENCPIEIYQIMLSCWDDEAESRPPFRELVEVFEADEMWERLTRTC